MHPFYFGSSDKQLYGVYHPPARNPRPMGVVLCPPFGQEYMRAHRAYRQLAMLLSRRGYHAFRFDYYGSGDSAGESDEASVDQWVADVNASIDELRETASLDRVVVAGLRLGGTLGAMAAVGREDIAGIVLWDPVVNGRDYVDELIRETAERVSRHGTTVGINGFPLTATFRSELEGINLLETPIAAERIYVVVSHERTEFSRLKDHLDGRDGFTHELVPSPGNWNFVDDFGGVLIPQAVIQAIMQWLGE